LLNSAAFDTFALYVIDDGFLIVTPPERILRSGMPDPNRWQIARRIQTRNGWFRSVGEAFSEAPEGTFRNFVIAITSSTPSSLTGKMAGWNRNIDSMSEGNYPALPTGLSTTAVDQQRLHVYLYYYERARLEEDPHQLLSTISLLDHLRTAGLEELIGPYIF
jgi:hypothetical protein